MRMTKNIYGHSVMVSNEEYSVLKKIKERGKLPALKIQEYYRTVADKLVSRGVLNKVHEDGKDFYEAIGSDDERQHK